jgi:hypothetical protein
MRADDAGQAVTVLRVDIHWPEEEDAAMREAVRVAD